jgi:hypothetical protein
MGPTIMTDQHGVSWTRHKTLYDTIFLDLCGWISQGLSAGGMGGWFADAWEAVWY